MSAREPSLFDVWGREVVKDGVLLLLAAPPLVGLLFVPMGLSNGRWLPPLAVVAGEASSGGWPAVACGPGWPGEATGRRGERLTPSPRLDS